jgi:hypothetical protein
VGDQDPTSALFPASPPMAQKASAEREDIKFSISFQAVEQETFTVKADIL